VEVEGMAALEALACGAPCLIADSPRSATPQFALDDRYLFTSGSVDSLTQRLDALLDDPAMLAADRARALELAARFGFENSCAELLSVYRDVLREREDVATSPLRHSERSEESGRHSWDPMHPDSSLRSE